MTQEQAEYKMTENKKKPDWIIAHDSKNGADAYMVECLRCGAKQRFVLPISVDVWVAAAKAFHNNHKRCKQ